MLFTLLIRIHIHSSYYSLPFLNVGRQLLRALSLLEHRAYQSRNHCILSEQMVFILLTVVTLWTNVSTMLQAPIAGRNAASNPESHHGCSFPKSVCLQSHDYHSLTIVSAHFSFYFKSVIYNTSCVSKFPQRTISHSYVLPPKQMVEAFELQ